MTRCPKCKSNLSVPKSRSAEAIIQCQRCRSEFSWEEILGKTAGSRRTDASAAQPDEGNWQYGSTEASAKTATSLAADEEKSKYVRRRYYSRTRLPKKSAPLSRRRRKRKPITKFTRADLIKIVLGALMAFPVAQLILWWGFAKDPFRLGPRVAGALPFVVPREFRGAEPIPVRSKPEVTTNPESALTLVAPFNFHDSQEQVQQNALQKGMSRTPLDGKTVREPTPPKPADDGQNQRP